MGERALTNRRRRASKGNVIRVSDTILDFLQKQRHGRSFDCMFRRMFGFPDRLGNEQPLIEGMLEVESGVFVLKLPSATWDETETVAGKLAALRGKPGARLEPSRRPIRMREWR